MDFNHKNGITVILKTTKTKGEKKTQQNEEETQQRMVREQRRGRVFF